MSTDSDGPPNDASDNQATNADLMQPLTKKLKLGQGSDIPQRQRIPIVALIHEEFRAGHSAEDATRNIADLLNLDYIADVPFDTWLNDLNGDKDLADKVQCVMFEHLLNRVQNVYASLEVLRDDPIRSNVACVYVTGKHEARPSYMAKIDGQSRIYCCSTDEYGDKRKKFALLDIFHGTAVSGPVMVSVDEQEEFYEDHSFDSNLTLIGRDRLLLIEHTIPIGCDITLLKLDLDTFKCQELDGMSFDNFGYVIFDEKNHSQFLAKEMTEISFHGIFDHCIFLTDHTERVGLPNRCCILAFSADKLYGFESKLHRNSPVIEHQNRDDPDPTLFCVDPERFFIYDLISDSCERIQLKTSADLTALEDLLGFAYLLEIRIPCVRLGNKFFVGIGSGIGACFSIYVADLDSRTFFETNIQGNYHVMGMSIDDNTIMTLVTGKLNTRRYIAYRFPLGKPDTLQNLAWFTIRRHSLFTTSDLYEQVKKRLPFNSTLRMPVVEYMKNLR